MNITVEEACALLEKGNLCALPTETVYGLAARADLDASVLNIFALKGRPATNPLIVHYSHIERIKQDVAWTPLAEKLAQRFFPGPLTLVLKRNKHTTLSRHVSAGFDTVAVRIPQHPLFQKILYKLKQPLAAPSANPSGALSPTQAFHVQHFFPDLPVVKDNPTQWGVESTVIDARATQAKLLRLGALTIDTLKPFLASETIYQGGSPGQHFRHYAPQTPIRLNAKVLRPGEAFLGFGQTPLQGPIMLNLSPTGCLTEAAHNLYAYLYALDEKRASCIAVSPIPTNDLGRTINERLSRAHLAFQTKNKL